MHTHAHTHIYINIRLNKRQTGIFLLFWLFFYYTQHVSITSPGGSTQQNSCWTATNHPSRKLSKLDEPDTQDTAGEVWTS